MAFSFVLHVLMALGTLAQPQTDRNELLTRAISVAEPGSEYIVKIAAKAANTSWEIDGRECAMLRVMVDGHYDQHIFLVRGAQEATYEFMLGPFSAGRHAIGIYWDRSWTPDLREQPEVRWESMSPIPSSDPAQEPLLRAPIVYIRKDTVGRFSDLPLVVYWESEKSGPIARTIYSVILTNEDGGTNTERLMARWGRTTDIEWFYEYSTGGEGITEVYQAKNHKTLQFQGAHEGKHPVLFDATTNNNFADVLADHADIRLRLVPVFQDLRGRTRESVMDRFPWTYSLMAQEMIRENKLEYPADANTPAVSDLRNYAYLEVCAQQRGTELFFELEKRNDPRWFRSDHADEKARIDRSGCFRTSIELPQGTDPRDLSRLRIQCSPAEVPEGQAPVPSPRADIRAISSLFFLGEDYMPRPNLMSRSVNRSLKPGKSMILDIPVSKIP